MSKVKIGKCKKCKFYRKVRSYSGLCLSGKVGTIQDHELDVLSVRVKAGGSISLMVAKNYGCIHWQPKADSAEVESDIERDADGTGIGKIGSVQGSGP